MPELPEVQTTVNGINIVATNKTITNIWTDFKNNAPMFVNSIKNEKFFEYFKEKVRNKKIVNSRRRGKNILIHLSNKETILIHMKMTGHIMYGKYMYDKEKNTWYPKKGQPALEDPFNRFIHLVFTLNNGRHLVLSDARKFAKITLIDKKMQQELELLGPEPLSLDFTFEVFISKIKKNTNKSIKTALMDQNNIVGIGNIYSDEILFEAKILPDRIVASLSIIELKRIFKYIVPLLKKGIDFGGDSMSDYRNIFGERGSFQGTHKVYRRSGLHCLRKNCAGIIQRKIINTRSAHFCTICQF